MKWNLCNRRERKGNVSKLTETSWNDSHQNLEVSFPFMKWEIRVKWNEDRKGSKMTWNEIKKKINWNWVKSLKWNGGERKCIKMSWNLIKWFPLKSQDFISFLETKDFYHSRLLRFLTLHFFYLGQPQWWMSQLQHQAALCVCVRVQRAAELVAPGIRALEKAV